MILRSFSKSIETYDQHAFIQNKMAHELDKRLPAYEPSDILELGCGTGLFTTLLRKKYTTSVITAIDMSLVMINQAKLKLISDPISWVCGDIQTYNFNRKFDLITSNSCLHWVSDLDETLNHLKPFIYPNTRLIFSIFGPKTFEELRLGLSTVMEKRICLSSDFFLDQDRLNLIFKSHFNHVEIFEIIQTHSFSDTISLLNHIKKTGTRGYGLIDENKKPLHQSLTRKRLDRLDSWFGTPFFITYQVFIVEINLKV